MSIASFFGWNEDKIKSLGVKTEGTVTKITTVTAIKINKKPVRKNALDGAVFPHIIEVSYTAKGKEYRGKRFLDYTKHCPSKGSKIEVFYDSSNPDKFAI